MFNLKIGKRIKSIFWDPRMTLRDKILPELIYLKSYLDQMQIKDPLNNIVEFFDKVSEWHDREAELTQFCITLKSVNYGQHDILLTQLNQLIDSFRRAGRYEFGWNRTKPGETVTENNVYLGNIYGLFTRTVRDWKKGKDEPKGGWGFPGMDNLNSYDVICRQAEDFIYRLRSNMVSFINSIQKAVA